MAGNYERRGKVWLKPKKRRPKQGNRQWRALIILLAVLYMLLALWLAADKAQREHDANAEGTNQSATGSKE